MGASLEIFLVLFSVFGRGKVTVNENQSFTDHASGIQLANCSKLALNWKNNNAVKFFGHDVIVKFLTS